MGLGRCVQIAPWLAFLEEGGTHMDNEQLPDKPEDEPIVEGVGNGGELPPEPEAPGLPDNAND